MLRLCLIPSLSLYPRFEADIVIGSNSIYAPVCKLSTDIVVHSNAISLTPTNYSECDYYYIKDGYTETSNNLFMTCDNKDAIVNTHTTGVRTHPIPTPAIGFAPAELLQNPLDKYSSSKEEKNEYRKRVRDYLKTKSVSGNGNQTVVNYKNFSVLWTQIDGPNQLTIDDPTILSPKVSEAVGGSYKYELYAVRMNGKDDYCEFLDEVKVDIHIPTLAAIEVKYQGIGDWTINRTAMCQDNIDVQWMAATSNTYAPGNIPDGSKLTPGEIKDVQKNVEYSIFRVLNDDTGGNNVTFTPNGFTAGKPGTRGYHVDNLPYNGTNLELMNCIDIINSAGNPKTCWTSDTITVFNNSVYADADVRIDPDKSKKDYKWKKQEVDICETSYELQANNPEVDFKSNESIDIYKAHGMWGYDDKDFKGLYTGENNLSIENTTLYKTTVTGLRPSDNHQRANALIWCVYRSILPPVCTTKDKEDICPTLKPNFYAPLPAYCAHTKKYSDFYESDDHERIYWYPGDGGPDLSAQKYLQISFTMCNGIQRYGFIPADYTSVSADDPDALSANYVKNKKEVGDALYVKLEDMLDLTKIGGLYANDIYDGDACDATVLGSSPKRCNKFYMQDDIANANGANAHKMRLWNQMSFMLTSEGGSLYEGRLNYNYYANIKDGVDTVYFWSDRQTHGDWTGGTTYECVDKDLNITKYTDNTINTSGKKGFGNYTYFKGADLLLVGDGPGSTEFSRQASELLKTMTWVKDGKTCYATQLDGGWNRKNPDGFGTNDKYSNFDNAYSTFDTWKACVLKDYDQTTNKYESCGLCGGTYHVSFVSFSLFGYGEPARIPFTFLKEETPGSGIRAVFFDDEPSGISYTRSVNPGEKYNSNVTFFGSKKDDLIAKCGTEKLNQDVPPMPGYDHAYHISGWRWDPDAINEFGADLTRALATETATSANPIVAYATNIDELKEESDNSDKHYWCVARDTLFIYDNTFDIEFMPSFVVCEPTAQLKGENPGVAAGANASGKWTVKTNTDKVTVASPTENVTNVSGLPAGETQFNWEVTRWTCKANKDVFVYYNVVESKPGNDVYTCDDFAQLEGVAPQSPSVGTWTPTEGASPNIKFGDAVDTPDADQTKESNNNKAWVFGLNQGDNPLTWTVENPQPPSIKTPILDDDGNPVLDANGKPTYTESYEKINGHTYYIQQSCPKETEIIVHDLRPDDAEITTGQKISAP